MCIASSQEETIVGRTKQMKIPNKCGVQDLTNAFAGFNKYSAQKQCKNQSNT